MSPRSPTSFSSLRYQWDAGSLGLSDGANVTSWTDGIGSIALAEATNPPVFRSSVVNFNNQPGVEFSSGKLLTATGLFDQQQPNAWYVVIDDIAGTGNAEILHTSQEMGYFNTGIAIYGGSANAVGDARVAGLRIVIGVWNGASSVIYWKDAGVPGALKSATASIGTFGTGTTLIVAHHPSSAWPDFSGRFAEIGEFNAALTATDAQDLYDYLVQQYGKIDSPLAHRKLILPFRAPRKMSAGLQAHQKYSPDTGIHIPVTTLGSYDFAGTDYLSHTLVLPTGDLTLLGWFNIDAYNTSITDAAAARIIQVSDASSLSAFYLAMDSPVSQSGPYHPAIGVVNTGNTHFGLETVSSFTPTSGWIFVAAVFDSATGGFTMFLGDEATAVASATTQAWSDGKATTFTGTRVSGNGNLFVGNRAERDRTLDGKISAFAIIPAKLTSVQLESIRTNWANHSAYGTPTISSSLGENPPYDDSGLSLGPIVVSAPVFSSTIYPHISSGISRSLNDNALTTDTLVRNVAFAKSLSDNALTPDTLVRVVADTHALNDNALTPDTLVRAAILFARALSDNALTPDTLVRIAARSRALSDNALTPDTLVRAALSFARLLSDGALTGDTLVRGALSFARSLNDNALTPDTLIRVIGRARSLNDNALTTDTLVRAAFAPSRALSDNALTPDTLIRLVARARSLTDNALTPDTLIRGVGDFRTLSDGALTPDTLTRLVVFAKSLNDNALTADTLIRVIAFSRNLSDNALTPDTLTKVSSRNFSLSDGALTGDTLVRLLVFARSLSDNALTPDTLVRGLAFARSLSDGALTSDTLIRIAARARTLNDNALTPDTLVRVFGPTRSLNDNALTGDTLVRLVVFARNLSDGALTGDFLSHGANIFAKSLSDNALTPDTLVRAVNDLRALSDNALTPDTLIRLIRLARTLSDNALTPDTLTRVNVKTKTLSDNALTPDILVRVIVHPKALSDNALTPDILLRALAEGRTLSDNALTLDTLARAFNRSRSLFDNALTPDTLTLAKALVRTLFDGAATDDTLVKVTIVSRSLFDSALTVETLTGLYTPVPSQDIALAFGFLHHRIHWSIGTVEPSWEFTLSTTRWAFTKLSHRSRWVFAPLSAVWEMGALRKPQWLAGRIKHRSKWTTGTLSQNWDMNDS